MIEPRKLPSIGAPFPESKTYTLDVDLISYEYEYRYKKSTDSLWTSWTSYTPGVTELSITNFTGQPILYNIEFRVVSLLDGREITSTISSSNFVINPTPSIVITNVQFETDPFEASDSSTTRTFVIQADVTTSPLYHTGQTPNVSATWFLYDEVASLLGSGSTTLTVSSGITYKSAPINAPVWEEPEPFTSPGSGNIVISASMPGTLILDNGGAFPQADCWNAFEIPDPGGETCYPVTGTITDSFTGDWLSDSYAEAGQVSVVIPTGKPMNTVTLKFNWYPDASPGENDIIIQSPEGTTSSLVAAGFDPTAGSGYYEVSVFDFSGDTDSAGTWIIRETDSSGNGGGEVSSIDLCLSDASFVYGECYSCPDIYSDGSWSYDSYSESGYSDFAVVSEPAGGTDFVWISLAWLPGGSSMNVFGYLVSPASTFYQIPLDWQDYGDYIFLTTDFSSDPSAVGYWILLAYDSSGFGDLEMLDPIVCLGGPPEYTMHYDNAVADIPRAGYTTDSYADSGLTTVTFTDYSGIFTGEGELVFDVSNPLGGSIAILLSGPYTGVFHSLETYGDHDPTDMTTGTRTVTFNLPYGEGPGAWEIKVVASAGEGYDLSNIKLGFPTIDILN